MRRGEVVLPQQHRKRLLIPLFDVCGISPPHDEALFFREKGRKPFSPVGGPTGSQRHEEISGSFGTRYAQTVLARFPNISSGLGLPRRRGKNMSEKRGQDEVARV